MELLGDAVRGALRRVGVPDAGVLAQVTRVWPGAVGPAVARSAWPLRIGRDGTLHVATSSAAWASELTLLEPEVRRKLLAALGPVDGAPTQLRFAVGRIPEPGHDPEEQGPPVSHATPDERAAAAAVASAIDDPELRELVRRAAAASLAQRRSDRNL
jgi:predicted nucleic acid-binding Zn ribbon protein